MGETRRSLDPGLSVIIIISEIWLTMKARLTSSSPSSCLSLPGPGLHVFHPARGFLGSVGFCGDSADNEFSKQP